MGSTANVVIVGGCGGLGYHLTKQCLEKGWRTAVLDVRTTHNRHEGAKYFDGSLTSADTVLRVLRETGANVLVNTASPRMVRAQEVQDHGLFDRVNIEGTRNLLHCAQESGTVKAFVYTSSSSIVHDQYTSLINATEELPYCFLPEQKEYYSHSKAVAEKMVLESNKVGGVFTTSIRAATMIGEGDTLALPNMVESAKSGRLKFQIGDGNNMFDFTYTGNTAHAHILAIEALLREVESPSSISEHLRVNGEAFFITNDEPWPFWEVPRACGAAAGYPVKKEDIRVIPASLYYGIALSMEWIFWIFTFGTKKPWMESKVVRYLTMTRTFDITKAKTRLGYKPLVSMEEGISRAGKWYRENNP